jgi:hypothetical protein
MIDAEGGSSEGAPRLLVGEETPPCESPCPGCGAYFFTPHADGCEYEQCARCGGRLVDCGGLHDEAEGER